MKYDHASQKEAYLNMHSSYSEGIRKFGRLAEEIRLKWARIAHFKKYQFFWELVLSFLAPGVNPQRTFTSWLKETKEILGEAVNLSNYYFGLYLEEDFLEKEEERERQRKRTELRRERRKEKRREGRRRQREGRRERIKREEKRKRRKEEKERRKKRKEEEKNLNN